MLFDLKSVRRVLGYFTPFIHLQELFDNYYDEFIDLRQRIETLQLEIRNLEPIQQEPLPMPEHSGLNVNINCSGTGTGAFPIQHSDVVSPKDHGADGRAKANDMVGDDTVAVQAALRQAATESKKFVVRKNEYYKVKAPLFAWGSMDICGEDQRGGILFDFSVPTPFAINLGISAQQVMEDPFTGRIDEMFFKIIKAPNLGRLILPWRSEGLVVSNNYLNADIYKYSLTSAQNSNTWVNEGGGQQYIRKDIVIEGNYVLSREVKEGGEGIGLGNYDGVIIRRNVCKGGGDDPLGIHFCHNVEIYENTVDSTDSRVFLSHCTNLHVHHNKISRSASRSDKKFQTAGSLIYVGFEIVNTWVGPGTYASTNTIIEKNDLYYPPGSKDRDAAINLFAVRNFAVRHNHITNDSRDVEAHGVLIQPITGIPVTSKWQDPHSLDPATVANVYNGVVIGNVCDGAYPQKIKTNGPEANYLGHIIFKDNKASEHKSDPTLIHNIPNIVVINPEDVGDPALLPPPPPPPPPPTAASPNCTEATEIVDNQLRRWTFSGSGKVLIDGVAPGSGNASGQMYFWANGIIYVLAGGVWYQRVPGDLFVGYGPTKPPCS